MKKIKHATLLRLLILPFWVVGGLSCQSNFLDLKPQSQPNADNFYRTANDFGNAATGAYDALQTSNQYGGATTESAFKLDHRALPGGAV